MVDVVTSAATVAAVALARGAAVAVPVVLARASFGYVATASWALLGIAVKNAGTYPGLAALAAAGIVSLLAVWWARRDRVRAEATA